MGTGLTSLKDVVYYVLDENGQPMGQAQKLEAVEASITYDDIIESKKDHEPFHSDFSGSFTFNMSRKNSKGMLAFVSYLENINKLKLKCSYMFKQVLINDYLTLHNMIEGAEKLEQIRKQENSRRWDFV